MSQYARTAGAEAASSEITDVEEGEVRENTAADAADARAVAATLTMTFDHCCSRT